MTDEENGVGTFAIYGSYDGINLPALIQYLNDSVDILSLWNHLPLLYCVKTQMDVATLRYKLTPFFQGNLFVVIAVNRSQIDGYMPKAAWDWFSTPAPIEKRRSDLSSLFRFPQLPPPRTF